MSTTYIRWIYHGEPRMTVGSEGNACRVDQHIGNEDVCMNEDEEAPMIELLVC